MNFCNFGKFLVLSTNCFALEWIFDPKMAKDMSIESHKEMLDSKLSWSGKSQRLTELDSDVIGSEIENDHKTRSGGGRGLKFPSRSNGEESSLPSATRFSRQFSLVPFSDLIKSREDGPSGTFSKSIEVSVCTKN